MLVIFAVFSLTVHLGTMVSQAIAPILRQDVACFGENDCYPLAFGVASISILLSFREFEMFPFKRSISNVFLIFSVIFLAGKRLYVITAPTGNVFGVVITCIGVCIYLHLHIQTSFK